MNTNVNLGAKNDQSKTDNAMKVLFQKYCQLNMRGLQYMGVGYENARKVMGIHLTNLAALFSVIIAGPLTLLEIDRKLNGIIGIILLGLFFLLLSVSFDKIPRSGRIDDNKGATILLTISIHTIVIILFCLTTYFFFAK